jgi:hypothetical protein
MNLEELKKEISFKWRVQSSNQYGASCVAYIDARQVQDLLDEVVGQDGWQCRYSEHKGNLFCEIGIDCTVDPCDTNWIWKSDCGVESNVEKKKVKRLMLLNVQQLCGELVVSYILKRLSNYQ